MREGEREGREYKFVSKNKFINMISNNEMLEYRTYHTLVNNTPDTWYYGLRKEELDPTTNYVVILDLKGVDNFTKYYGKKNCFVVYVCCDKEERERRAIERGSFDKTEWDRRLVADDNDFNKNDVNRLTKFTMVNMSDNIEDIPKAAKIIDDVFKNRKEKKHERRNS